LRSQWTLESAPQVVTVWLPLSASRAETIHAICCQYDGIAMGARKSFEEAFNIGDHSR